MYIRTIKTMDKDEFDFEVNRYCKLIIRCNGTVHNITVSHPQPFFPHYIATIIFKGCTELDIEMLDNVDMEPV